jgi:hypothetical protein
MNWPPSSDFREALEHPLRAFQDADLRRGQPLLDDQGQPRAFAGDSADVFQVRGPCDTWAVKCYRHYLPGLKFHYQALKEHFLELNAPWLVETTYLRHGISIRGHTFPVVKMRWVEGEPLHAYARANADAPLRLRLLAQQWQRLTAELRQAGVAHGALQAGHVLVATNPVGGGPVLRLIDYDGLFVPALAGQAPLEFGDAAFQHPQRLAQQTYDAEVDRFPQLAVLTALYALAAGGVSLWRRHDAGTNLLFRAEDFASPATSGLFRELWESPDATTRALTGQLLLACLGSVEQVPLLDDLARPAAPWAGANTVEVRPLAPAEAARVEATLRGAPAPARPASAPVRRPVHAAPPADAGLAADGFNLNLEIDASAEPEPPLSGAVPLPPPASVPLPTRAAPEPPPLPPPVLQPVEPPPLPVVLKLADEEEDDDIGVVFRLEAWMPERVAMMKLQGFVTATHSEIVSSSPGLMRVRLVDPYDGEQPPLQGMLSWLGLVEQPRRRRRVLALLELSMQVKETEFKKLIKMTVRFLPPEGGAQAHNQTWRRFCDKTFCELRGYLMGGQ